MSTMKDVAKRANVSVATVSNYLNATKNVGPTKRLHIENAIKSLNYVMDPNAQLLKKGINTKIGIILPGMNSYYNTLHEGLESTFFKNKNKIELIITNDRKEFESASIERLIKEHVAGFVVVTCQPENEILFEKLKTLSIPFILVEREVYKKNYNYISFDNYETIKKIVSRLLEKTEKVLLIAGPVGFKTEDDCANGFLAALKQKSLITHAQNIIRTRIAEGSSFHSVINFLREDKQDIDYFIATSTIIARGLKSALQTVLPGGKYKIICLGEGIDDCFKTEAEILYTPRSPYLLGIEAANILLDNIKSPIVFETKQRLVKDQESILNYFIDKLFEKQSKYYKVTDDYLKVLILEDPLSSSFRSIINEYQHRKGLSIRVESCNMNGYYDYLMNRISGKDKPDLFLIDVPWIDYFANNGIAEKLDHYLKEDRYYLDTFVPKLLKSFSESEGSIYALPYSYTNQLLFYRKDLFEDINLKKDFEEKFKMPLRPPKNWVEFNAVARFFTKKYNINSPVEYGTTMAVAYPQAVAPEFLLRLWSFGGDIFDSMGKVIIDSKSTKRAIENYCECFNYATPNALTNMPSEQVKEFQDGKAAMAIAFFSYGSDIIHSSNMIAGEKVGFSIVPSKVSVLSGWSMCINSESEKKKEAVEFLKWLCGPSTAIRRAFLEGQSSQEHIYLSTELLKFYPWLSTALQSLEFTNKRSMPKINGGYISPEKTVEDAIGNMIYSVLAKPEQIDNIIYETKKKLQTIITR